MPGSPPIDWHAMGYTRAMANVTGSTLETPYPTLDVYTTADEAAFIAGFNEAQKDFAEGGYQIAQNYIAEKEAESVKEN